MINNQYYWQKYGAPRSDFAQGPMEAWAGSAHVLHAQCPTVPPSSDALGDLLAFFCSEF